MSTPTVYALHENPEWFPPFARAFEAEGVHVEEWLLTDGVLDLDAVPPEGIFWSRISASSHTRDHALSKDYARAVLSWLEAHGRRTVNGRRILELEMSKVDQLTALRAAGIDTPHTVAGARSWLLPRISRRRLSPSTTRAARAWACGSSSPTKSSPPTWPAMISKSRPTASP